MVVSDNASLLASLFRMRANVWETWYRDSGEVRPPPRKNPLHASMRAMLQWHADSVIS